MAFDRSERGRRREQHPRRGEGGLERGPRDQRQDDRDFYSERDFPDRDADYTRPPDRRHWRGHDYDTEEEYERGRSYGTYGRTRERPLSAEHRYRFLRGDAEDYSRGFPPQGREDSSLRDTEHWSGPYAGRGPKGYRRSDERIYEEVCERLTEHPGIDASDIEVSVSDGDVSLAGQVESRAVKHLTESMVETVRGVKEVHNQLRVVPAHQEYAWRANEDRNEPRPQEMSKPRRR